MPAFPSTDWFCALRDLVNQDDEYRHLGTCEARVGFLVGNRCYAVLFDAFSIGDVEEIPADDAEAKNDFVLEMAEDEWQELVENIRKHGRADADHTLNTLVFADRLKLRYQDSIGMDKFYQYNQSLQYFLDASPRLDGA